MCLLVLPLVLVRWGLVPETEPTAAHSGAEVRDHAAVRAIAVEILQLGGRLEIAYGNQTPEVARVAKLPPGPFLITGIMADHTYRVDDQLLARIVGLEGLQLVDLKEPSITDEGAQHLGQIASLTWVDLRTTQVTDRGLVPVAALPRLERLFLSDTKISDETLDRLAGQQNLWQLEVKHTKVTDRGMEAIGQLPRLKFLDLRDNRISDRGLQSLRSLRALEKLGLDRTDVTAGGIAELERALPNCKITRGE
jgi:hypothetical protein